MDKPKANVSKSKSSNSAITTRSDNRSNKKSRSSAEFQPSALKKRGVYVEKKQTKLEINTQAPAKPPPRPRPGKKRFLASVLTILSKSTASTQFPEVTDDNNEIKPKNYRRLKDNVEQTQDKKKHKYRSRVLKENRIERQKVVILKHKKDIVQTPSNSESSKDQESIRWLDLPRLVKQESVTDTTKEQKVKLYEDLHVDMATNVIDNRKMSESRALTVDNDPKTLVSDDTKDRGIYNFFVDLLETTFSVYNVKPQYDVPSSDVSASKEDFMIDENVAKKLNVTKAKNEITTVIANDMTPKFAKQHVIKKENDTYGVQITDFKAKPLFPKIDLLKSTGRNSRLKSKSFNNPNRTNSLLSPRTTSPNRSSKKIKKKDLMSFLMEELKMDDDDFEEPQNLFEALQVIARNKRKCKKSIRFDKSVLKTDNDSGDPECIFKRRNIMSISSKSTKKAKGLELLKSTRSDSYKYSDIKKNYNYRKNVGQSINTTDFTESLHTLEVYGVDYENPFARRQPDRNEDMILPYHSSPTVSENVFGTDETILNFSDSEASLNFRATESNVLKLK